MNATWDLTSADRLLVGAKRLGNRLRFAVMLLFFRTRGRFPRSPSEVDEGMVAARRSGAALLPEAADRTAERQRAEIRALFGFREMSVDDAEALGAWLRDNVAGRTRDIDAITAEAEVRCRALRLEPPSPDRTARIVRGAVRAHDDRRHAAVLHRLTLVMRTALDALLQP